MKLQIVNEQTPPNTLAIRVCTEDGTPIFNTLVTREGESGELGYLWFGMGEMTMRIRAKLFEFAAQIGVTKCRWYRKQDDGTFRLEEFNLINKTRK